MDLAYITEGQDEMGRLLRKQWKIEKRLAGGNDEGRGGKPKKGMHQATYDRLLDKIASIENEKDSVFSARVTAFLIRTGMSFDELCGVV